MYVRNSADSFFSGRKFPAGICLPLRPARLWRPSMAHLHHKGWARLWKIHIFKAAEQHLCRAFTPHGGNPLFLRPGFSGRSDSSRVEGFDCRRHRSPYFGAALSCRLREHPVLWGFSGPDQAQAAQRNDSPNQPAHLEKLHPSGQLPSCRPQLFERFQPHRGQLPESGKAQRLCKPLRCPKFSATLRLCRTGKGALSQLLSRAGHDPSDQQHPLALPEAMLCLRRLRRRSSSLSVCSEKSRAGKRLFAYHLLLSSGPAQQD